MPEPSSAQITQRQFPVASLPPPTCQPILRGFQPSLDQEDEVLKNLTVDQIKQILKYVRSMEQSSKDLQSQMQQILSQIETMEASNLQLKSKVRELEATKVEQSQEIKRLKENVRQRNEQVARLDYDNS